MFDSIEFEDFLGGVTDSEHISGFTHEFYNYPARFSPKFVKETIKAFSKEGELIIDPFMGGGTTLVESKLLGRNAIGFDISSLANFITNVKISTLNEKESQQVKELVTMITYKLNCHKNTKRPEKWIEKGYQRNLSNQKTWPIRKLIEQTLLIIDESKRSNKIKNYVRCGLLKVSQWALDSSKNIPSTIKFKNKLKATIDLMLIGTNDLMKKSGQFNTKSITYNCSASSINRKRIFSYLPTPKLILTSPPYPGIHILYHRWQIGGRKETPAPFWIANSVDGHGISHYTMGGRHETGINKYFNNIENTFSVISKICDKETMVVQMLAFSEPETQLPRYLESMNKSGFKEIKLNNSHIWREVPNRKWYTQNKNNMKSSKEVVLFHKLS